MRQTVKALLTVRWNSDAQKTIQEFTDTLKEKSKKAQRDFIKVSAAITAVLVGTLALSLVASYREINKEVIELQGAVISAQPLVINAEKSLTDETHIVQDAEKSLTAEQSKLVDINNKVRDSDTKLQQATHALTAATQDLEKTRKQYADMIAVAHKGKMHGD